MEWLLVLVCLAVLLVGAGIIASVVGRSKKSDQSETSGVNIPQVTVGSRLEMVGPIPAVYIVDYVDEDGEPYGRIVFTFPKAGGDFRFLSIDYNVSLEKYFVKYRQGNEIGIYEIIISEFSFENSDEYDFSSWNWTGVVCN